MPKFWWRGVDMYANVHSGYMLADTEDGLDKKLLHEQIALLSCNKVSSFRRAKLTHAQRADIYEQLARLLDAGVLLPDALISIAEGVNNARVYDIICDVVAQINQGSSLHEAIGRYSLLAPKNIVHVLVSGEKSGKLSHAFNAVAKHMRRLDSVTQKMQSALLLPALTGSCFVGIIVIVVGAVVPRFAELLSSFDQELPAITKHLVALSEWFSLQTAMCFGGVGIISMLFVKWGMKKEEIKQFFDWLLLRIPFIGIVIEYCAGAYFFQSLSLLLQTGVPLSRALQLIADGVSNNSIKKQLLSISDAVYAGRSFEIALARHASFCRLPSTNALLRVGQTSGTLDQSCAQLADEYFSYAYQLLSRFTKLLQPVCVIILGVCITGLMIALYAPLMQMSVVNNF